MNTRLDHIGIAVRSLEAAKIYETLGLAVQHTEVVETQRVKTAFLSVGDSNLDLVIGGSRRFGGSRLSSVAEAIGMVALVPVGILIVGVPFVALGWAVVKAIAWLAGGR